MKKQRRIKPVFLIFFIIIGVIFLSLVADYFGAYLLGDVIPRERTMKYYLEQQMLPLIVEKMKRTGKLPEDLDDMEFESEYLKDQYRGDRKRGLIKWFVEDDKLVVEFRNDATSRHAETVLPPELLATQK
jgi:hypothetical protein